jgi:[ribosomal protein S18]-alanine N-acetyltransferase
VIGVCRPTITVAGEGDIDAIAILEAAVQEFPWTRRHFSDSLAAGHRLRVCRDGTALAGFSVAMTVVDEAHLLDIVVGRDWQGRGLGAALLRGVMDEALGSGAEKIFLEVRASNQQAIGFYERFGFSRTGLRRGYYPAATGREDALIYQRELT